MSWPWGEAAQPPTCLYTHLPSITHLCVFIRCVTATRIVTVTMAGRRLSVSYRDTAAAWTADPHGTVPPSTSPRGHMTAAMQTLALAFGAVSD